MSWDDACTLPCRVGCAESSVSADTDNVCGNFGNFLVGATGSRTDVRRRKQTTKKGVNPQRHTCQTINQLLSFCIAPATHSEASEARSTTDRALSRILNASGSGTRSLQILEIGSGCLFKNPPAETLPPCCHTKPHHLLPYVQNPAVKG